MSDPGEPGNDADGEAPTAESRISALWGEYGRVVTEDDLTEGRIAEVIRWCRERLGGTDQDLVGPLRWAEASDNGWSERATYACLPNCGPKKTWQRYLRDLAQYVCQKQQARQGAGPAETHAVTQARLELELTVLVVGWLTDEANGRKRSFPQLVLTRPPDLRPR